MGFGEGVLERVSNDVDLYISCFLGGCGDGRGDPITCGCDISGGRLTRGRPRICGEFGLLLFSSCLNEPERRQMTKCINKYMTLHTLFKSLCTNGYSYTCHDPVLSDGVQL